MDHTEDDEQFSLKLSKCMDLLGYSFRMIKYRQQMNQNMDQLYNTNKAISNNTVITTGGKGEGTSKYFESDVDRLFTLEGIVCLNADEVEVPKLTCDESDDIENEVPRGQALYKAVVESNSNMCLSYPDSNLTAAELNTEFCSPRYQNTGLTVFELDTDGCSSGYGRLSLRQLTGGPFKECIKRYLVHEASTWYLRNEFSALNLDKKQMFDVNLKTIDAMTKTGPSVPHGNSYISYDFVSGIVCEDNCLLQEWAHRPRPGYWPPPEVVRRVCGTKGQIVPVAHRTSQYPRTEWRICFTEGELLLMRSFNECQIKVYIVIKVISKSMLKPICKDISSYVIKNLVMWLVEQYPTTFFKTNTLFKRCMDALHVLRECIQDGQLQSYVITGRNLFKNGISTCQRQALLEKIDYLILVKTKMFKSIAGFGNTLDAENYDLQQVIQKSQLRDGVETLLLRKNVEFKKIECDWFRHRYEVEFEDLVEKHEQYNRIDEQMQALLVPDKDQIGSTEFITVFKERLRDVLT